MELAASCEDPRLYKELVLQLAVEDRTREDVEARGVLLDKAPAGLASETGRPNWTPTQSARTRPLSSGVE